MAALPWRLNEIWYPTQEVRARIDFDPDGPSNDPELKILFNHGPVKDAENTYGATVRIETDKENSTNLKYEIRIEVFAIFSLNSTLADLNAALPSIKNILIGAAREHISSLTSKAPWGEFLMQPVIVSDRQTIGDEKSP